MKTVFKFIPVIALALGSTAALANPAPHSDADQARKNTVKTRTVSYSCQGGKKVAVKYGFNKQNLPTYAQASLNGKTRFMPINLNRSDAIGTVFGDEDNFSLSGAVDADSLTFKNIRKSSVNIQSPGSEIIYKGCTARKR